MHERLWVAAGPSCKRTCEPAQPRAFTPAAAPKLMFGFLVEGSWLLAKPLA
jgi:hypothetical protein